MMNSIAAIYDKSVLPGLYRLFSAQCGAYTGGQSTSLPVETARELFTSVCFTLNEYAGKRGLATLENVDLEEALSEGRRIIKRKSAQAKAMLAALLDGGFQPDNTSYRDTVRSIGGFFERYDMRYFAHGIPCDIDYQLCLPIPEQYMGIEYILRYIKRLDGENRFCARFDRAETAAVMMSFGADHRELLINAFSPVFTNAIGRVLSDKDLSTLDMSYEDGSRIFRRFAGRPPEESMRIMDAAADRLCDELGIQGGQRQYIIDCARELIPRISRCSAQGIFIKL